MRHIVFSALLLGSVVAAGHSDAQTLYWIEGGAIQTSDVFGPAIVVVPGISNGSTMTLDAGAGYLFWIDFLSTKRANIDGGGEITLFSAPGSLPQGMTVDEVNQRLFWLDPGILQIRYMDYDCVSSPHCP